MRLSTFKSFTCLVPPLLCEWCREAVASQGNLCGPCQADFKAAEVEGVELFREDFQAEAAPGR